MSDAARQMELIATYEHFVRNYDLDPVTITLANNAVNAILNRTPPYLRSGQDYAVNADSGLQPGTWFKFAGTLNVRLSQPATASGVREATILPYAA